MILPCKLHANCVFNCMVAYLRGLYNTHAVNQAIEGGLGSAIRRGCITDIASFWHSVCVLVMLAQSFWPVCLVEGESMARTYEFASRFCNSAQ